MVPYILIGFCTNIEGPVLQGGSIDSDIGSLTRWTISLKSAERKEEYAMHEQIMNKTSQFEA